jgi:hypothetical protein
VPDFVENLTARFGLPTTATDKGETEKKKKETSQEAERKEINYRL